MEIFLIRALQLMMSLSLLVLIHEGGHFLFAKLFKVRVEKFCLFFDPWFTLFKFKPKNSETEYGLGWLPLGGYVKISGMIDESMDTEQMKQPVKEWEFRAKPAWQRLFIMIGGVLFNFLLALFIYSMILYKWGDSYIPLENISYGMKFNDRAHAIGFQDGDILLRADDKKLERFGMDMLRDIIDARTVTVKRDGQEATVYIPEDLSLITIGNEKPVFIDFFYPAVVDSVIPGHAAALAGIQSGDSIIAINDTPINSWNSINEKLEDLRYKCSVSKNREELLAGCFTIIRQGEQMEMPVRFDTTFVAGVYARSLAGAYEPRHIEYGFFESFPAGITHGINVLKGYVSDMRYVFSKEGATSLGGFATIGSIFPSQWDWQRFWEMTAFLSIILAFMNILPIPALDGGHVLFLIYEIVTRRKPSDKFLERAQIVGMCLLLILLVWANFNDIIRFLF
jgi:regulator of sigma E protease